MKRQLLILTSLLFSVVSAQNLHVNWEKQVSPGLIPNINNRQVRSLSDSSYLVVGDLGAWDKMGEIYISRITKQGDLQWVTSLGGSSNDMGYEVVQSSSDTLFLIGSARSQDGDIWGNHGHWEVVLIKLTLKGDTLWTKCLGGSEWDSGESICLTTDSNLVVAGNSKSNDFYLNNKNKGGRDFWVVKLNTQGDTLWSKTYGGGSDEAAYSVCATPDTGIVVAGYTTSNSGDVSNNNGGSDIWVVRLNKNGEIMWDTCYGGSAEDYPNTIANTPDGGFLIAGYTSSADGDFSNNYGETDGCILKIDASGELEWEYTFGAKYWDNAFGIETLGDTAYMVSGYEGTSNNSYSNAIILTLDLDGNLIDKHYISNQTSASLFSLDTDINGGIIACGNHFDENNTIWLVNLGWKTATNTVSLNEIEPVIYPNPVKQYMNINLASDFEYYLYDISGNLLKKSSNHLIDFSSLLKGTYLLKIKTDNAVYVQKVVHN